MRKCKKRIVNLCFILAMMVLIPSIKVHAAEFYTVTYRPGNVGYFALEANEEGNKQAMAEAVAHQEYSGYEYEVTKNGAIKLYLASGSSIPDAPTYIQTQAGYFVQNTVSWGPNGETIAKNTDYVVDYGKLVDGVEYTVRYVDSESGDSIAPVYITQANIGETRSVSAPLQIVISGGAVYNLVSEDTMEIVLDADASKNVFTFSYKMEPAGTILDEVVIGTDGQIITTTDYVTSVVDGGTVVAANQAGVAEGGAQDENAALEENQEDAGAVMEIGDNATPLAGLEQDAAEGEEELLSIEDGATPLSNGSFANMAAIGAFLFVAAALLLAIVWLFVRRKRNTVENTD